MEPEEPCHDVDFYEAVNTQSLRDLAEVMCGDSVLFPDGIWREVYQIAINGNNVVLFYFLNLRAPYIRDEFKTMADLVGEVRPVPCQACEI